MNINCKHFSNLLLSLKEHKNVEENISDIFRNLEETLEFQSIGVYIRNRMGDKFILKNERNISHSFRKGNNYIEFCHPLIKDISKFDTLSITPPSDYKFEFDYSHLLIYPLYFQHELYGFFFIDRAEGLFAEDIQSMLSIYASIMSTIIMLSIQQNKIEQLTHTEADTGLWNYKGFVMQGETLFIQMQRYKRTLTLGLMKILKYDDIFRTIGNHNIPIIIRQVSDIIKSSVRQTEVLGMLYPDTFAILFPETPKANINVVIERINSKLESIPVLLQGGVCWGIKELDPSINNMELFINATEADLFENSRK